MENSILAGTKEFSSTHHWREREKDNKRGFRSVLSAEVIYNQPISDDRVNGERGIDERDDAALYDSLPGRRRGKIVEPAEQYRSTLPCFFVLYRNNPASAFCLALFSLYN